MCPSPIINPDFTPLISEFFKMTQKMVLENILVKHFLSN